jgi:hypothetical protein
MLVKIILIHRFERLKDGELSMGRAHVRSSQKATNLHLHAWEATWRGKVRWSRICCTQRLELPPDGKIEALTSAAIRDIIPA